MNRHVCKALAIRILYALFLLGVLVAVWSAWLHQFEHKRLKSLRFYWNGSILKSDSYLGYTYRPQVRVQVNSSGTRYVVKTNALGLRIPEVSSDRFIKTGGLAGIGCSVMFGHGMAAEDTLLERLGRRFNLPVYNLGVASYSSVTSILRLQKTIETLQPNYVLYLYGDFHYGRSIQPAAPSWLGTRFQPFFTVTVPGRSLEVHPPLADNRRAFNLGDNLQFLYIQPLDQGQDIPWDLSHWAALSAFKLDDMGRRLRLFLYEKRAYAVPSEEEFSREILTRLTQLTSEHQAKLMVACLPFRGGSCSAVFQKTAQIFENEGKLIFIDLKMGLKVAATGERYAELYELNRFDSHPNVRFQEETAAYLMNEIEKAQFIPSVRKA